MFITILGTLFFHRLHHYLPSIFNNVEEILEQADNFGRNLDNNYRPLNEFELMEIKSVTVNESKDNCCSICLHNIEVDDREIILKKCKHVFHSTCIKSWFKVKSFCPLCKEKIDFTEIKILEFEDFD